jgi:hypothetical protein
MTSTGVDSKGYGDTLELEASGNQADLDRDHAIDLDEKAKASAYKADAVEAENAEHNMGVLEAIRAYPMASFWAFVMSFTIVSYLTPLPHTLLTFPVRSWNPTMSSSLAISSP